MKPQIWNIVQQLWIMAQQRVENRYARQGEFKHVGSEIVAIIDASLFWVADTYQLVSNELDKDGCIVRKSGLIAVAQCATNVGDFKINLNLYNLRLLLLRMSSPFEGYQRQAYPNLWYCCSNHVDRCDLISLQEILSQDLRLLPLDLFPQYFPVLSNVILHIRFPL